MTCILCGQTALYVAGGAGYCKQHKAEAYAATAEDKKLVLSKAAVNSEPRRKAQAIKPWQGWKFEK